MILRHEGDMEDRKEREKRRQKKCRKRQTDWQTNRQKWIEQDQQVIKVFVG